MLGLPLVMFFNTKAKFWFPISNLYSTKFVIWGPSVVSNTYWLSQIPDTNSTNYWFRNRHLCQCSNISGTAKKRRSKQQSPKYMFSKSLPSANDIYIQQKAEEKKKLCVWKVNELWLAPVSTPRRVRKEKKNSQLSIKLLIAGCSFTCWTQPFNHRLAKLNLTVLFQRHFL